MNFLRDPVIPQYIDIGIIVSPLQSPHYLYTLG